MSRKNRQGIGKAGQHSQGNRERLAYKRLAPDGDALDFEAVRHFGNVSAFASAHEILDSEHGAAS